LAISTLRVEELHIVRVEVSGDAKLAFEDAKGVFAAWTLTIMDAWLRPLLPSRHPSASLYPFMANIDSIRIEIRHEELTL
jgi:hypothetical protein